MMLDSDFQLDRALARISEPAVTVISDDAATAVSLPDRWRIQRCTRPVEIANGAQSDLVLVDASFADRHNIIEECRALTAAPLIVVVEDRAQMARYLELGADACVSRRATAQEWQARFEASIRVTNQPPAVPAAYEFTGADLRVSLARQAVQRSGATVDLTPRELEVLCTLLTAAPAAVPGERIAELLWGASTRAARGRVRVYVARLRQKLELDPARPRVIVTDGSAYRTTLKRTHTARREIRVLLVGHDDLTAERRRRELAMGDIETTVANAATDLVCGSFDAVVAPADPVEVARARLMLGHHAAPIIATTEQGDPARIIATLEAGAVDVVPYPGRPGDLPARIAAAVRRARTPCQASSMTLRTGALEIDLSQRRVESHGREIPVSPTEYRLLSTLAGRVDQVMSHQELLTRVWGPEYRDETHYIRVYVRSLRAKLEEDPSDPRYVISEWGRGYRLAALPVERPAASVDAALMA